MRRSLVVRLHPDAEDSRTFLFNSLIASSIPFMVEEETYYNKGWKMCLAVWVHPMKLREAYRHLDESGWMGKYADDSVEPNKLRERYLEASKGMVWRLYSETTHTKGKRVVSYKPYYGPGGPSQKQADNNTRFLQKELEKLGWKVQEDWDYLMDLCGVKGLNLIAYSPLGTKIKIGYDRWGFCSESSRRTNLFLDQASLEETLQELQKIK